MEKKEICAHPAIKSGDRRLAVAWKANPGTYLGGHAAGDSRKRNIEDSKKRCEDLGDSCGGFTCNEYGDCTVRKPGTLKGSPYGETTYTLEAATYWKPNRGYYLSGYAAGDSTKRNIEKTKERCLELGSKCGGFTCFSDGMCTVRGGKDLKKNGKDTTSYILTDGTDPADSSSPSHSASSAGPLDKMKKECLEALSTYCSEHMSKKGVDCSAKEERECQVDTDCQRGYVCREFECREVPECHVTIFGEAGYRGASQRLDPVTAIDHPGGKYVPLKNMNMLDSISSLKLGRGCNKVLLYDDDPGNLFEGHAQNSETSTSKSSLSDDLNDDVKAIKIWAKNVEGHPPFDGAAHETPTASGKAPPVSFNPAEDKVYARAVEGSGLMQLNQEESDYFPNVGKSTYGYNHYYGAPFSTKFAGTDPGFRARSVWQVGYNHGNKGDDAKWVRLPMSPNARYFVVVAAKHDQINQMQEDVKNPNAAANRFLEGKQKSLRDLKQQIKEKTVSFDSYWWQRNDILTRRELYLTPPLPVHEVDDTYCSYEFNITQLMDTITEWGDVPFREEIERRENSYEDRYFGRYRRLAWMTQRSVGEKYCEGGSVKSWKQADFDRVKKNNDQENSYWEDRRWYRRLAPGRRLYEELSDWCSTSQKPNMREFGSLAKAKQALRSEAKCLDISRGQRDCPSGADYNFDITGTLWDKYINEMSIWDRGGGSRGTRSELTERAKIEWPRFIVKVVDDKVVEVDSIDGQQQTRGMRAGFDSVLPHDPARKSMMDHLEQYIMDHPSDATTIKPTRTNIKAPDGWKVTRSKDGAFCEKDFKSDMIADAHSYEKMTSSSFGIPHTAVAFQSNGGSFGLSYEKKHFLKSQGSRNEKMVATQGECGTYHMRIQDLQNNPPPTDPAFQFLVDGAESKREMWSIFDMYGLHFPDELVFGSRYGTTQMISKEKFEEYQSTETSFGLEFGVSVAIPIEGVPGADIEMSRDVSIGFNSRDDSSKKVDSYFSERRSFTVGKRMPAGGVDEWMKDMQSEPMPIKFSLVPMCDHPVFKAKVGTCRDAWDTYCEEHLKRAEPDLDCGNREESQCTWDIDCLEPHMRCEQNQCVKRPECEVTLYKGGNYDGDSKTFGGVYFYKSQPYKIFDLQNVYGWRGAARSMKVSGGCAKVIKMKHNSLDDTNNFVLTNFDSNHDKKKNGVRECNYLALYAKEWDFNEQSDWS